MKLWLDGQCFQTASRLRGIGRYVLELTRAIGEERPDIELSISFNAAMPLEAISARVALNEVIAPQNMHVWQGAALAGEAQAGYDAARKFSELALAHHVNCLDPDIAISTSAFEGQSDIAVPLLPTQHLRPRTACIFYDAIPYHFKEIYLNTQPKASFFDRRLAACAEFDLLLCISEYSVTETQKLCKGSRAVNIGAGVSKAFETMNAAQARPAFTGGHNYILYVGGLDWRKNVSIVTEAIAKLPFKTRRNLHFVLAGDHPAPELNEITRRWARAGLDPANIRSTGHVTDEELVALNAGAALVVQPSRLEGFGLGALEALIAGTPVAAARAGALPEIVPYAESLFDPDSADELAACMSRLLSDGTIRAKIANDRQGFLNAFNWRRSASTAIGALEALAPKQKTPRPPIQSLRELVTGLVPTNANVANAAKIMAAAEPISAGGRIIVEATNSVRYPTTSGIQRVVRETVRRMKDSRFASADRIVCAYGDLDGAWFEVPSAEYGGFDRPSAAVVRAAPGDTIVMLDSSWDLHLAHEDFLVEARLRGARIIFCLYDLVPLWTPAFCADGMTPVFRNWFLSALKYATGFICISQAVAHDLQATLRAMNFPRPMPIDYWRLGADIVTGEVSGEVSAVDPRRTVNFLTVGTIEPRKGHFVILKAFEQLWAAGRDVSLTIVGKPGWAVEDLIRSISSHPELGRRLRWHRTASDDELLGLYAETDVLISASFAEGFGLPIVEAGRMGKPVIVSDLPVFREVAGGAPYASFFKPGSADDLAHAVAAYVDAKPTITPLRTDAWPDWRESAAELLERIQSTTWRCTFVPSEVRAFSQPDAVGKTHESERIAKTDQTFSLEVIASPSPADGGAARRIILKLTNLSARPWFGEGTPDGRYGVKLAFRPVTRDGLAINTLHPRIRIPLVLPPGASHYLAADIPAEWRREGAEAVEFELVQEGVEWWGGAARVEISA